MLHTGPLGYLFVNLNKNFHILQLLQLCLNFFWVQYVFPYWTVLLQTSTPVPPFFLDSSKLRHRLRRKLAEDKKLILQEIEKYNGLVLDSATNIDVAVVEHSLTGESTVSQIWPWEVHGSGMSVFRCFTRIYLQFCYIEYTKLRHACNIECCNVVFI